MSPISNLDELEHQTFKNNSLCDQNIIGRRFISCTFKDCDFTKAKLDASRFLDCEFKNCNLSNTSIDGCSFKEARFFYCKIIGADFCSCDQLLFSVSFRKCLISLCNFSGLKMPGTLFFGSMIEDCDFVGSDLSGADFNSCVLTRSIFHNTDLKRADFRLAKNFVIDPANNQLRGARFSVPEVLTLLDVYGIKWD